MMWRLRVLWLAVLPLIVAAQGFAQNTEDQNRFDFSLPGARSRAIGGAFVAIADDATSAYSNPAGLTQLFRPEVAVEGRQWRLTSRAIDRGHGFGKASGVGVDNIDGFVEKDFHSNVAGLSFLSFVYPSDRWALGIFRHELSRQRMKREIYGPFFDCRGGYRDPVNIAASTAPFCEPNARGDGVDREFPKRQSFALDIDSVGTAFAYDVSETLSAGIALQYFTYSLDATNKVFSARDQQKYLPPNFTDPENLEGTATQTGHDHAWAINAGLLWKLSPRWAVGGSLRQGPQFDFSTRLIPGPRYPPSRGVAEPHNAFHVPDTYSLGVAHRVTDYWRVSFEYDRVNFHQLIDDFRNTVFEPGNPETDLVAQLARLNNANQLRLGAERLILLAGSRVLALRGGLWYDPNHQMYIDADEQTGLPAPRWALLHPRRDGTSHVSAGVGFTTRRHFQFDAAIDFSDLVDTLAVSTVWRF